MQGNSGKNHEDGTRCHLSEGPGIGSERPWRGRELRRASARSELDFVAAGGGCWCFVEFGDDVLELRELLQEGEWRELTGFLAEAYIKKADALKSLVDPVDALEFYNKGIR